MGRMRADLRAYLVGDDDRRVFGPGPAELLERVDALGSLRAAAIEMGMAYTKATRIVREAEAALGFALTERTVGGSGGGGSSLTPAARDLLVRYRAFERSCERDLSRNFSTCFAGFGDVARVGCVVMASGAGTRFGGAPGDKLLAPLAGVPVLERTLAALPSDALDVVVVTRWPAVEELCRRLGVRCAVHDGALQSDSVRVGLAELSGCPACLFVPGDQPLLTEGGVRAVLSAAQAHPGSIVRLSWQGRPAGPVLWPAGELEALAHLEGDAGGRALLAARGELAGRVRLVEARDEWEVADVDVAEDLAALAAQVEQRGESL